MGLKLIKNSYLIMQGV